MHRFLQLALDLFDPPSAQPPERVAPTDAAPRPGKPGRPRLERPASPAAGAAQPQRHFPHVRGNRESVIGHSRVGWELQRARRRSIGFVVGPDGLTVRAPRWVPLYEIEAALQARSGWILKRLDEATLRRERLVAARIEWCDGAQFPCLGEPVQVVLDPRQDQAAGLGRNRLELVDPVEHGAPRRLKVGLSHQAEPAQVRDAVQAWLMREAERVFTDRLNHFAPLLGVRWTRLRLSSANTRWGTAHADGTIRLNWRLIHFRMAVIDYVVAHELSHLRVMDHSPKFWDTVATVVPDYAHRRTELRDDALPQWGE